MIGNIYVTMKGPVVEGYAEPILTGALNESVSEVASYTLHEVGMELIEVLQHPTGYYESQIKAERVVPGRWSVNDSNVIYGPWLEGISHRNQTTRFKGYATFRRVKNRMAQKAEAIINAAVAATVKGL